MSVDRDVPYRPGPHLPDTFAICDALLPHLIDAVVVLGAIAIIAAAIHWSFA